MLRSSRSKKSNRDGTASSRRVSLVRLKKTSQEFVRRWTLFGLGTEMHKLGWVAKTCIIWNGLAQEWRSRQTSFDAEKIGSDL